MGNRNTKHIIIKSIILLVLCCLSFAFSVNNQSVSNQLPTGDSLSAQNYLFTDLGLAFRNPEKVHNLKIMCSDSNEFYLLHRPDLSFSVFTNLTSLKIAVCNYSRNTSLAKIDSLRKATEQALVQITSIGKLEVIDVNGELSIPSM